MSENSEYDEIEQQDTSVESETKKLHSKKIVIHKSQNNDFAPATRISGVVRNELYHEHDLQF